MYSYSTLQHMRADRGCCAGGCLKYPVTGIVGEVTGIVGEVTGIVGEVKR